MNQEGSCSFPSAEGMAPIPPPNLSRHGRGNVLRDHHSLVSVSAHAVNDVVKVRGKERSREGRGGGKRMGKERSNQGRQGGRGKEGKGEKQVRKQGREEWKGRGACKRGFMCAKLMTRITKCLLAARGAENRRSPEGVRKKCRGSFDAYEPGACCAKEGCWCKRGLIWWKGGLCWCKIAPSLDDFEYWGFRHSLVASPEVLLSVSSQHQTSRANVRVA